MITKTVIVTQVVNVAIDETKFDDVFMKEFRESFYHFATHDDHIEHIAQLFARGLYDNHDFIEGYGPADDMGISVKIEDVEMEIES